DLVPAQRSAREPLPGRIERGEYALGPDGRLLRAEDRPDGQQAEPLSGAVHACGVVDASTEHLQAAADAEHGRRTADGPCEAAPAKPGEVGLHMLRARENDEG